MSFNLLKINSKKIFTNLFFPLSSNSGLDAMGFTSIDKKIIIKLLKILLKIN